METALQVSETDTIKLSPLERRFSSEYFANSGNGTRAYLAAKPHVTRETAKVEASRLLTRPNVKAELERLNNEVTQSALVTRTEFINRMQTLSSKAEKNKSYQPAINAAKEAAIVSGVYEREDDDASKFGVFINQITVNQAPQIEDKPQDVVLDGEIIEGEIDNAD
jgi:hypothetical protein